jgi:hypothetical protein
MDSAQQAMNQMQQQMYQALRTSLWYYVFLQTENFSAEQPLLSVHSGLVGAHVFDAARRIACHEALLSELATYVFQYVGAIRLLFPIAAPAVSSVINAVLDTCHPCMCWQARLGSGEIVNGRLHLQGSGHRRCVRCSLSIAARW